MAKQKTKDSLLNRYQQLINIASDLGSELDLNILLSKVVQAAADVSNAQEASILMYDPVKESLYFQAATNLDTQLNRGLKVPIEKSIAGWIVTHQEPLIVDDPQKDSRHFDHIGKITNIECRSLLGIPLVTKGSVIGVLEVINKEAGNFSREDQEVLMALGAQAAVAIENSRLFLQSDLIGEFVHEIRTPLSALSAAVHLLKNKRVSDDQKAKMIDILEVEIQTLAEMSNSFLDLARLESGRKHYHVKDFDLRDLLHECYQIMENEVHDQGLSLDLEITGELPRINGDRGKLKQAFINLLNNAIKFNQDQGNILITAQALDEEVMVSFADTGVGIPRQHLDQIFKKFFRVPEHRDQIPGTGLGLSVVKQIITGHGGRILVDSEEGVGTTFTIYLPVDPRKQEFESS